MVKRTATRLLILAMIPVSLCLAVLTGCQQARFHFDDIISGGLFTYPGTQWNMTPEEVMEALDLTEEQFIQSAESGGTSYTDRVFIIEGFEAFDVPADVCFWFRAYRGYPNFGLKSVTWILDDEADMDAVRRDLEAFLGNASGMNPNYSLSYWDSKDLLAQYVNDELAEEMKSEYILERVETEAAVSLIFVNEPSIAAPIATLPSVSPNAKMIILSSNLADVMQIISILQEGCK